MVASQEVETKGNAQGVSLPVEADKRINEAILEQITTPNDVADLFGGDILDFVTGGGFELLQEKDQLIGVPFVIVEWNENLSEKFSGPFASIVLITDKGDKYVINDGSTGIYQQLETVRARTGRMRGIAVKNGLRRSDYEVETLDGKTIQASTYYLA